MKSRLFLSVVLVLSLVIGVGCGGGGSNSGGGSSPATVAGTWNLSNSSGGSWPQQVTFNSNGTGTYSGAQPSSTGSTSGTLTWTQQGTQVSITPQGGTTITIINLPSPVGNTISLIDSSGRTATYNRA